MLNVAGAGGGRQKECYFHLHALSLYPATLSLQIFKMESEEDRPRDGFTVRNKHRDM